MKITKTNIHLYISILVVIPAAIIYGFFSDVFLDINPNTINESNAFKATMMLYLGFTILWILGIRNQVFTKTALISNCIFMFGLAMGRIVSIVVDGIPGNIYLFGTFGELLIGVYGVIILKEKNKTN